jgi:hypothetical protein
VLRAVAALRNLVQSAAGTISIEPRDLVREVHDSGGTIATVAEAHGVDPQLVIDNAVAAANERIDQAVADGKVDPSDAEALKAKAAAAIEKAVMEGKAGRPHPGRDAAP